MNKELLNAAECYQRAEQKAAQYFKTLYSQVSEKTYVPFLMKDIQSWKQFHLHRHPLQSFFFS